MVDGRIPAAAANRQHDDGGGTLIMIVVAGVIFVAVLVFIIICVVLVCRRSNSSESTRLTAPSKRMYLDRDYQAVLFKCEEGIVSVDCEVTSWGTRFMRGAGFAGLRKSI